MAARYPENAFVPAKLGTGLRLVVGEAPGELESLQLEPLVGGSGKRFDAMCRAAGVGRESLTIVNTIQCRPPQNIYPTDAPARSYIPLSEAEYAVDQCYRNHVLPVLRSKPWERVDLLGDKALRRLSPDSPHDGIMANRGFPVPIKDLGGKRIGMPTIHPAAVARDQIYTKVVIADLSKGLQLAPEKYNPFPSLEDVQNFKATTYAYDIENTIDTHEVYMVGLSAEPYKALCVPFKGAYVPELRRIFSNAKVAIGHNSLQHDEPILRDNGVSLSANAVHYDTMLMAGLLLPDLKHSLEFCASIFIPKTRWKYLKGDAEEVYNCRDVDITYQLWQQFLPMLKAERLHDLYLDVQVPLAKLCKMMTDRGVRVEPGRVKELREKFGAEVERLDSLLPLQLRSFDKPIKRRTRAAEGTVSPKSGKVLKWVSIDAIERVSPWRSSDDVAAYLYDELHLPKQLHVKSQQVTVDKTALEKLGRKLRTKAFEGHPQREEAIRAIETLSAIKKLATLLSSFATEELSAATSAHSHFRPDGTASGRLSSSDPNLQNQPEKVRFLYVPRNSDWTMVDVDYSGIEARLTAFLAGDTERLDKYLTIPDYSEHRAACEVFFGIPYAEVKKDNDKDAPYGKAKRIVHGTNYGLGARKLALMYDMQESEVRTLIAKWKAAIPKTTLWQERTAKEAEQNGVLTTPFGRKRWFWCVSPDTKVLLANGTWKEAELVHEGDVLVGFDEELKHRGEGATKLRRSIVWEKRSFNAPRIRVNTDKGDLFCTPNHALAVQTRTEGARWITAEFLKKGDTIAWFREPWETLKGEDAAWISGFLSGEGYVRDDGIGWAQRPNEALAEFRTRALRLGLDVVGRQKATAKTDCFYGELTDHKPFAGFALLGMLRPPRLIEKIANTWEGHNAFRSQPEPYATVLSIETLSDGPVVGFTTSSKTLITDGFLSHNTDSVYTESLSFLPQSTAADVIFRAMIGLCFDRIGLSVEQAQKVCPIVGPLPQPACLLLQVHDSLLIETPKALVPEVVDVLHRVLEQGWPELSGFSIPIDVKTGESWGQTESYK